MEWIYNRSNWIKFYGKIYHSSYGNVESASIKVDTVNTVLRSGKCVILYAHKYYYRIELESEEKALELEQAIDNAIKGKDFFTEVNKFVPKELEPNHKELTSK